MMMSRKGIKRRSRAGYRKPPIFYTAFDRIVDHDIPKLLSISKNDMYKIQEFKFYRVVEFNFNDSVKFEEFFNYLKDEGYYTGPRGGIYRCVAENLATNIVILARRKFITPRLEENPTTGVLTLIL